MATIKKFEEMEVWKDARKLALEIYELTLLNAFSKDNDLCWQIRKSSGSTMDNIAEGFERDGKNEFIQFLSIAKGSAGETRSQLYRALDRKHISKEHFEALYIQSVNLIKKISKFMAYLKSTNYKGNKYKD